ncbi:MAG: hypothetical protein PF482_01765 [Desulfobacteraceae bacterium]|nr:hypothetical protein [Desulfobacteraceae bacterium]
MDDFFMISGNTGTKPIKVFRSKACEDIFNCIHDHTGFIRSLMNP